jgi:transposase
VQRGYKFLTVVYQIDNGCRRLLWVGRDRTVKTMLRFFRELGKERSASLRFVCSDMWKPYLKVIAKKASQAIHVLDRFHIMAKMNKAIDEVRAQEAKELKAKGLGQVLKGTRWTLLKRPENRTLIFRSSPSPSSRGAHPFALRGVPTLLELRLAHLGRAVPRPLVHPDHAFEDRNR